MLLVVSASSGFSALPGLVRKTSLSFYICLVPQTVSKMEEENQWCFPYLDDLLIIASKKCYEDAHGEMSYLMKMSITEIAKDFLQQQQQMQERSTTEVMNINS